MTSEIVQSDIELAQRLMDAGCSDSAIVAWLGWRGVAEPQAARLVAALRRKPAAWSKPLVSGQFPPHKSTSTRSSHGRHSALRSAHESSEQSHGGRPHTLRRRKRHHRRWGVALFDLFAVALALAGLASLTYLGLDEWRTVRNRLRHTDPNFVDRVSRSQQGLPLKVNDDLKHPAPGDD